VKHEVHADGSETLYWRCPGCNYGHSATVKRGVNSNSQTKVWGWNGSVERCTLAPSYVSWNDEHVDPEDGFVFPAMRCHVFITDGQIQFLSDCTHGLAGKTVPLS
jgi:hypothetical protein